MSRSQLVQYYVVVVLCSNKIHCSIMQVTPVNTMSLFEDKAFKYVSISSFSRQKKSTVDVTFQNRP